MRLKHWLVRYRGRGFRLRVYEVAFADPGRTPNKEGKLSIN
jgi:hypothetical protein